EALVAAGGLFMQAVRDHGAELLPIDSEHNAIFQCLPDDCDRSRAPSRPASGVRRLLLTASGGPFRTTPAELLRDVTPAQACAHPNWSMGRKISVDSATMLNKGLEVIEAHWLFSMEADRIQVLIHPQSLVHSMVEYEDGSILAQLGQPDMRTPIAYALGFPERIPSGVGLFELARLNRLDFEEPDLKRFPCLGLAFDALRAGQSSCINLNAANEVAVARFLEGRIRYTEIPQIIGECLDRMASLRCAAPATLGDILDQDHQARVVAAELCTLKARPALFHTGHHALHSFGLCHRAGRSHYLSRVRPLLGRASLWRARRAILGRLRQSALAAHGSQRNRMGAVSDSIRRLREVPGRSCTRGFIGGRR